MHRTIVENSVVPPAHVQQMYVDSPQKPDYCRSLIIFIFQQLMVTKWYFFYPRFPCHVTQQWVFRWLPFQKGQSRWICSRPFSQPRDAAQRQGELKSGQEKFTSGGGKRGLLRAPKMDFMRLRNKSTLTMISMEISTEIIYRSDGSLLEWSIKVSEYQALT